MSFVICREILNDRLKLQRTDYVKIIHHDGCIVVTNEPRSARRFQTKEAAEVAMEQHRISTLYEIKTLTL